MDAGLLEGQARFWRFTVPGLPVLGHGSNHVNGPPGHGAGAGMEITRQDKALLLAVARAGIDPAGSPMPEIPKTSLARESFGAFVSVYAGDDLRGCIGTFTPREALYLTVKRLAEDAAYNDSRFPPVEAADLPQLKIEISVLSPLFDCSDIQTIEVGKHGLCVSRGWNRGVLLPQVATERGWDRETFLEHTCLKAGLPRQAWRDPEAHIEIFTATVFHGSGCGDVVDGHGD